MSGARGGDSRAREAISRVRHRLPSRQLLGHEGLAALPRAISNVPNGMATSLLAGVNPIQGLHASVAGAVVGGLTASTRLMVITTTGAAALAAGGAINSAGAEHRAAALSLLTLIAGLAMVVAGLARLGRITRFVSSSVMTGFLTGVAINIVFGQIPDLTGASAEGQVPLAKAIDVLTHPSEIQWQSLVVGVSTLVLLVLFSRTRLSVVGAVVALVVPSLVVAIGGVDGVAQVRDVGSLPVGVPLPALPDLSLLSWSMVSGALAVMAIVLVQGAGVAEAVPNADGRPSNPDRDFLAQGAGNVTAGFLQGMPVGASVVQTALNRSLGARTRWASVFSGVWLLVILAAFSWLIGTVAMPTLAAILIYAAIGSIQPGQVLALLRLGFAPQLALVVTLVATLVLSIPVAVGIGVALSLLLQLNREALDLTVVQLVPLPDGKLREQPAPRRVGAHQVVLLDVYGSLLYAGARTLQAQLPDPNGAHGSVVILRMRHRSAVGATFFLTMADYAHRLRVHDARLYLSGVDAAMVQRMRATHRFNASGPVRVFEATDVLGESSLQAYADAETWVVEAAEGQGDEVVLPPDDQGVVVEAPGDEGATADGGAGDDGGDGQPEEPDGPGGAGGPDGSGGSGGGPPDGPRGTA